MRVATQYLRPSNSTGRHSVVPSVVRVCYCIEAEEVYHGVAMEAMDALQKLEFHTFLLYPAKLKATRGVNHLFNTLQEVKDFINSLGK